MSLLPRFIRMNVLTSDYLSVESILEYFNDDKLTRIEYQRSIS
jgi:hypothetical protein